MKKNILILVMILLGIQGTQAIEVKQLHGPYSTLSECGLKKEANDIEFPKYVRTSCFKKDNNKYFYYFCRKGTNACESAIGISGNRSVGDDISQILGNITPEENPYAKLLSANLLIKLKRIVVKIEELDSGKLRKLLVKLEKAGIKYKSSTLVTNVIGYLKYEIKRVIGSKGESDDLASFLCEFGGKCTAAPEQPTTPTQVQPPQVVVDNQPPVAIVEDNGSTTSEPENVNYSSKECDINTVKGTNSTESRMARSLKSGSIYGCKAGGLKPTYYRKSDMACVLSKNLSKTPSTLKNGASVIFGGKAIEGEINDQRDSSGAYGSIKAIYKRMDTLGKTIICKDGALFVDKEAGRVFTDKKGNRWNYKAKINGENIDLAVTNVTQNINKILSIPIKSLTPDKINQVGSMIFIGVGSRGIRGTVKSKRCAGKNGYPTPVELDLGDNGGKISVCGFPHLRIHHVTGGGYDNSGESTNQSLEYHGYLDIKGKLANSYSGLASSQNVYMKCGTVEEINYIDNYMGKLQKLKHTQGWIDIKGTISLATKLKAKACDASVQKYGSCTIGEICNTNAARNKTAGKKFITGKLDFAIETCKQVNLRGEYAGFPLGLDSAGYTCNDYGVIGGCDVKGEEVYGCSVMDTRIGTIGKNLNGENIFGWASIRPFVTYTKYRKSDSACFIKNNQFRTNSADNYNQLVNHPKNWYGEGYWLKNGESTLVGIGITGAREFRWKYNKGAYDGMLPISKSLRGNSVILKCDNGILKENKIDDPFFKITKMKGPFCQLIADTIFSHKGYIYVSQGRGKYIGTSTNKDITSNGVKTSDFLKDNPRYKGYLNEYNTFPDINTGVLSISDAIKAKGAHLWEKIPKVYNSSGYEVLQKSLKKYANYKPNVGARCEGGVLVK